MNVTTINRNTVRRWLRNPRGFARWLQCYDYESEGLTRLPEAFKTYFPHVREMRSFELPIPHLARQDRRFESDGILLSSWDEVTVFYNYGLRNSGQCLLEIGSWVGWSTIALALAGLQLTVLDPVFSGAPQGDANRESQRLAGISGRIELISGYSPQAVWQLRDAGRKWPLFFIDGDHEGKAPEEDTEACLEVAQEDALILYHDLMRPNLGEVLSSLEHRGWSVGVHYTANFLGVAWRGRIEPLSHRADPRIDWEHIIAKNWPHLQRFRRL